MILIRRPWTRKPSALTALKAENRFAFTSPIAAQNIGLTATGTPQIRAVTDGVGYSFGGNSYLTTGAILGSGGSGNDPAMSFALHVWFVVTSNASTECVASIGDTYNTGSPRLLLQNNSGTLRCLLGSYTDAASTAIGRLYCMSFTYSDMSPYKSACYLDGVEFFSANAYNSANYPAFIGAGFPGYSTNHVVLQSVVMRGETNVGAEVVRRIARDPWNSVFLPRRIIIPVSASGIVTPTLTAASASNITSTTARARVTFTRP